MATVLKLCSYNSHGLGPGRAEYIKNLVHDHDFVLLQEHWLHEEQLVQIHKIADNVNIHGVSGMDSTVLLKGRPFGGCAIIWKKSFLGKVVPVNIKSNRMCCVEIQTNEYHVILFNVYMPVDAACNITEYESILSDISTASHMCNTDSLIIGGDFNTDLARNYSSNTRSLVQFVDNESLRFGLYHSKASVNYTYESKSCGQRSTIDHFICSENLDDRIVVYKSLHHGDNFSDHCAVSVVLNVPVSYYDNDQHNNCNSCDKVMWCKATPENIANYQLELDILLGNIVIPWNAIKCKDFFCRIHTDELDIFYNCIINACLTSGISNIPVFQQETKCKTIPGWNDFVDKHRNTALFWHSIWKANNSPRSGIIADIRNKTRYKYHYALRSIKRNKSRISSEKMATSMLNNDCKDFWSEVNKIKNVKKNVPNVVDNCTGESDIANMFNDKYKDLYNTVSYCKKDMSNLIADIDTAISTSCSGSNCNHSHNIYVADIRNGIKHLKKGRNDGNIGHTSDHLIHGSKMLYDYLSLLFDSILFHGYTPDGFVLSTITSIPKCKRKSLNDSNNYRGIALSSILSKLFDWIILIKHGDIFESSDLQFGFKPGHSTTQCTFVVKETINYYVRNGGQVYMSLLDASKAFDRVNYIKLFRLLYNKGLCPLIIRFLLCMYTNQTVRVKWGSHTTKAFNVSNGVKQGGVLSPILFNVYIDELLNCLKNSGVGCYIGHIFVGSLAYADDISLLAPTRYAACKMLDICKSFSDEFDILFNPNKSKLIIFDKEIDCTFKPIVFNDIPLECEKTQTHLGNHIGQEVNDVNINKSINDFYSRVNVCLSLFNHVHRNVLYKLFKSFCMPLYGCQLWNYESDSVNKFYVAWRKCIRRLFNIPIRTHNALLNFICGDIPIDAQLHKRFVKFMYNIMNSKNKCVNICGKLAIYGSQSQTSCSINYVCDKYGLCKYFFHLKSLSKLMLVINEYVTKNVDKSSSATASIIRDFLEYREDLLFESDIYEDVTDIINYICTKD